TCHIAATPSAPPFAPRPAAMTGTGKTVKPTAGLRTETAAGGQRMQGQRSACPAPHHRPLAGVLPTALRQREAVGAFFHAVGTFFHVVETCFHGI
ncbi:MAG: hypothetical protein PUI86_05955, partial [Bacteroidales bacterium]|nr:hypothetical protein [Bacteroidales bacterium]